MPAPQLFSFRDLIDHAVDFLGGAPDEKNQRACRVAADGAYREMAYMRNWAYLYRDYYITLSAPYSTGTVAYTSSTRTLTLTGGTWPSWALYGHVVMDDVPYRVESRSSDTVLILESGAAPVANIAAGETYTIYRSIYTLPSNFKALYQASGDSSRWDAAYIPLSEWSWLERHQVNSGSPVRWTVGPDPNLMASFAVYVHPYPDTAETFQIHYQAEPQQLKKTGYATGEFSTASITFAATSGAAAVTGTGTAFDSTMIGATFRTNTSATQPDGVRGLNPWIEQKIITAVAGTTALTVDSNFSNSYTAKAFVISDPVDIAPHMLEALFRCIEYKLAVHRSMRDVSGKLAIYRQELLRAFEADDKYIGPRYRGSGALRPSWTFSDALPTTYDT